MKLFFKSTGPVTGIKGKILDVNREERPCKAK
ncbi:hypothetical protein BN990_02878 [Virgibacillus salexigens]|uniref:Uncharacterized protein n=1 Tax=Virgibacillus massiliensis TaxID=1462526 RepID=A0A024QDE6_9BACI|nr:hypothetical protein BN990_02878 [Virgibacillus massiliensis]